MKPFATISARHRGFTLVELIMVIVLMGVIGGIMSVFIRGPIDAYISAGRRAALTDVADTTARRIARDIRRALPNSIRPNGANCLEFIPTKTGGRYRVQDNLAGDSLDFAISDTTFNRLGSNSALPASQQIAQNDLIVVYNLGIAGADAYDVTTALGSTNWTTVSAAPTEPAGYVPAETVIPISGFKFPLSSGSNRFHVVAANEQMVSYVCSGTTLFRAVSTVPTAAASCPTATAGSATVSAIATNVNCPGTSFTYTGPDLQRNALVTMVLSIQDSSATETVNLQHEVHVDNTP
ncbi:MAG: prepilin-type N-terminal cleavage/methylation domain-containing protein [Burkholderiales bacterium]